MDNKIKKARKNYKQKIIRVQKKLIKQILVFTNRNNNKDDINNNYVN